MFFNAGTWPSTIDDPTEARDRYHRVALYEARIAAEQDRHGTAFGARRSLVDRVRAAIGLAPSTSDTITCGAC
jgi:hypothetical protein